MMGQVGVQPCPAAITATIKTSEIVVIFPIRLAVDMQIALATKLNRSVAQVHADMLTPARTLPP